MMLLLILGTSAFLVHFNRMYCTYLNIWSCKLFFSLREAEPTNVLTQLYIKALISISHRELIALLIYYISLVSKLFHPALHTYIPRLFHLSC